jgi:UDP-N-acetylglucosamine--N-acetylmuramyl-(pentapeptide) pyrophosphoryl-undecaprenol N-acetylglucosamine transferase
MTVVYVAATGGHLAQLRALAPRIGRRDDALWITFDTPQSRSLLHHEARRFIPYIAPRDWPGVARALPDAVHTLRSTRPSLVVSTGNAIALAYLPVARTLGIPAAYIESAARADGPSLTGKILRRIPGMQLLSQYESWAAPPWRYAGSIFDGYTTTPAPATKRVKSVLVTLGTIPFEFPRAVKAVLASVPADCEIVWQVGATDVTDFGIAAVETMSASALDGEMRRADVIVAHAGIGSVLGALAVGKTPILLSRSSAHGEHIDDHQSQIAGTLDRMGLAIWRAPDSLAPGDFGLALGHRVSQQNVAAPLPLVHR